MGVGIIRSHRAMLPSQTPSRSMKICRWCSHTAGQLYADSLIVPSPTKCWRVPIAGAIMESGAVGTHHHLHHQSFERGPIKQPAYAWAAHRYRTERCHVRSCGAVTKFWGRTVGLSSTSLRSSYCNASTCAIGVLPRLQREARLQRHLHALPAIMPTCAKYPLHLHLCLWRSLTSFQRVLDRP